MCKRISGCGSWLPATLVTLAALSLSACAQGGLVPKGALGGDLNGLVPDGGNTGAAGAAGTNANSTADAGMSTSGTGAGGNAGTSAPVGSDAGGDVFKLDAGDDASNAVSCNDLVQNGLETGVDCGGLCPACSSVPDAGSCTPTTCGAMECGQKSDGCGKTLTCTFTCASGSTCSANKCTTTTPPACSVSSCPACPALQAACCKSSTTCGCAFLGFLGCG